MRKTIQNFTWSESLKGKSVILMIGSFFLLAIIPLFFFIGDGDREFPSLLLTMVNPPAVIIWLIIFLASFFYAKRFRQTFFETLKILNLGTHTYELAKNSFIRRKIFFIFLVIFEILLASSNWLYITYAYPGYQTYSDSDVQYVARLFSVYVPLAILVVPLMSRIFSSVLSSTLSIRNIIAESSIDSIESDISNKVRTKSSDWTYPFLIWIGVSIFPGALVWPETTFFIIMFLCITVVSFLTVEIKNHRHISKVNQNILKQLEETKQHWRLEIGQISNENYSPSEKEISEAILSYELELQKVKERVRKTPTSFFQRRVIIILLVYQIGFPLLASIQGYWIPVFSDLSYLFGGGYYGY